VTLIAFTAAAVVLLFFASRLSWRLRRLRDEAENAIDAQGRIRGLVAGEHARDEIGDLSRSFSTVLQRLAQYNDYLEQLAGRLTHELRTPIAVVRSSLDNMRLQSLPRDLGVYLARAEDGLNRLETILTRMAEATRLEQIVRGGERERFDAGAVVAGCVEGYRAAYPGRRFVLKSADQPVPLNGAPDLFAQMLDKLAANAADFATGEGAIEVSLERKGSEAILRVANTGPLLPADMKDRLFESMVSVRRISGWGSSSCGRSPSSTAARSTQPIVLTAAASYSSCAFPSPSDRTLHRIVAAAQRPRATLQCLVRTWGPPFPQMRLPQQSD